jgi:Polyketide cyclase / dehydrase and lipid transport
MRSRTVTAVFPAPPERVFGYMSDIENLPRWATEFARELKVVDGRHVVVNGLGEFVFEIRADRDTGVVDMYAGPSPEAMGVFPTRVVPMPGGGSAYSFTMFQAPDMPDELFESQYESLEREFENLKREFAGG